MFARKGQDREKKLRKGSDVLLEEERIYIKNSVASLANVSI